MKDLNFKSLSDYIQVTPQSNQGDTKQFKISLNKAIDYESVSNLSFVFTQGDVLMKLDVYSLDWSKTISSMVFHQERNYHYHPPTTSQFPFKLFI